MIRLQLIDLTRKLALVGMTASLAFSQSAPAAGGPDSYHALLSTYCFTCHNSRAKVGGLALDALDLNAAPDDAQTWEKALRKLRGHLMPPPGARQPAQKDVDAFMAWMENQLDSHPKGPKAG